MTPLGRPTTSWEDDIAWAKIAKARLDKVDALAKRLLLGISESELVGLLVIRCKYRTTPIAPDDVANVEHADGVFGSKDNTETLNFEKGQSAVGQASSQVNAYLNATGGSAYCADTWREGPRKLAFAKF